MVSANQLELLKVQTVNDEPVVDALQIAQHLGVENRAIRRTIESHLVSIESNFGRVAFQMQPLKTASGTQMHKVYYLTEEQAYFVTTLSKNTERAVKIKALLVKSFMEFRRASEAAPWVSKPGTQGILFPDERPMMPVMPGVMEEARALMLDVALQVSPGSKVAKLVRLLKPMVFYQGSQLAAKGGRGL